MKREVIMLVTVLAMGLSLQAGATTVVADFDIPPPSNINGAYGAFSPSSDEMTYTTVETLDDAVKHGQSGSSMRLDYNVEKSGTFNGFWMKMGPAESGNEFDASKATALTFWVKADPQVGIPKAVKVEVKGDPGTRIGRQYIKDLTADWKKIVLPLQTYADQGVDLTKLNEIVVVFESSVAAPGAKGRIWIDSIAIE
ncbi:MAG: hypothetical protein JXB04_12075 [Kiritimatiellae bacterium]|nr:hypothetical protein [Kiritimatiellia bacterium]